MNDFNDEDMSSMVHEMEKEAEAGKFQSKFWSPKNEGNTQIRIISPLKEFNEKLFYLKYRQHYVGGHPYMCLNQTLVDKNGNVHEAEACPICKRVKQLYDLSNNDRESEEAHLASGMSAKDRFVSRIIVRGKKDKDGKDTEAVPEFYEFGKKIHEILFNAIKLGECGNFLSLKTGRDLNLSKKGTGRNTDYSGTSLSMKQSPVFTDAAKIKQLAEELPKMDYKQLVEFKTYDELENLLKEAQHDADDFNNDAVATEKTTVGAPVSSQLKKAVEAPAPAADVSDELDDLLSKI